MLAWLEAKDPFPPVERALKNPNGLLAAGGELSVERLLEAYRRGVFPWYSGDEPVLWWSPDPRMVLYCDELKVPRSLAKSVRNKGYEVRVDTAFAAVLEGCADRAAGHLARRRHAEGLPAPAPGRATPIPSRPGADGELVGGLYGVAIGRMFYGESMFSRATDASKVALVALVGELRGARLPSDRLPDAHPAARLARRPRDPAAHRFCAHLTALVNYPEPPGKWTTRRKETA